MCHSFCLKLVASACLSYDHEPCMLCMFEVQFFEENGSEVSYTRILQQATGIMDRLKPEYSHML